MHHSLLSLRVLKNHCLISIFQYISYRMMHTYFLNSRYTSPPPTAAMTHSNSNFFFESSSILLWSTSACLPQQSLTLIFIYWYYTQHHIQSLYCLSLSTILTLFFSFISIPEYPLISLTVSVRPYLAAHMKAVYPSYMLTHINHNTYIILKYINNNNNNDE